ncbi:MAG: VWA domain-containing protein [Methanobrevibacter sp.]|jgi:magnesium chelatase subunit D|nr:VWA domain-containing protein [Candidatus Methanovirga basalitermitum]
MKRNIYPFTAIVGQNKIKKALILNAVNPSIGGVLIKGDRGTGKTTTVRALADLLPEVEIVEGSPFNVNEDEYMDFQLYKFHNKTKEDKIKTIKEHKKVVELPLGATEDRIIGSMNIEKGLKEGIKQLEPGILTNAHNNILYIDEINLLDDNLIDILLDSAAFGVNIVEREGISIKHPSRFILIGTMNSEEGELRKQLSDRIGLEVSIKGIKDVQEKIRIMKYRHSFEKDPDLFREKFKDRQIELKEKIKNAMNILENVDIEEKLIRTIATITNNLRLEGHRKDITILKTSKTIAAFEGSRKVSYDNIVEAIELVLGEYPECLDNLQDQPQKNNSEENKKDDKSNEDEKKHEQNDESNKNNGSNGDKGNDKQESNQEENQDKIEEEKENLSNQTQGGVNFKSKQNENEEDDLRIKKSKNQNELNELNIKELEKDINKMLVMKGKEKEKMYGSRVNSKTEKGKYVKTKFSQDYKDIAIDATLRAAVTHSKNKITVKKEDLRTKIRKHKAKASIAIVMDMSGSMMNDEKINKVKGILDKIIKNVNKNRDKLSVIDFKGKESEIIIPNTKRPSSFLDKLEQIKIGGTTPMATGLKKGYEILKKEKKQGEFIPMLILLSDGMPNVGIKNSKLKTIVGSPIKDVLAIGKQLANEKIYTIIINFEKKIKQGRNINLELAIISNGKYYDLENVHDSSIAIDKILTYERTIL